MTKSINKNSEEKHAVIVLTKDELDVLIWLIDDWRNIMSEQHIGVAYPNNSISSTQLIRFLNNIRNEMIEVID